MLTFLLILNIFFATLVILCGNPVYSIISFILVILGSCVMLLRLGVVFLTFIILLVYIGAVAVVFLFVLFLLRLKSSQKVSYGLAEGFFLTFFLIKITWFLYWLNSSIIQKNELGTFLSHPVVLEEIMIFVSLYSNQSYYFLLSGVILLFSMIGSISLCTNFIVKGSFYRKKHYFEYLD